MKATVHQQACSPTLLRSWRRKGHSCRAVDGADVGAVDVVVGGREPKTETSYGTDQPGQAGLFTCSPRLG